MTRYPLKTRSFGGLDNTYAINVSSLAQAIETNGIKMQYILFDACYMSNVETAYELKDATNFLLASPNEIMAKGLPYEDIWSYLNTTTPNYASIISSYYSHYNSTSTPYASLAAIDCRQMDKLAAIMKDDELLSATHISASCREYSTTLGRYLASICCPFQFNITIATFAILL